MSKVNQSLSTHHEGLQGGGGTAAVILNHGIRLMSVVSFSPRKLFLPGKSHGTH